MPLALVFSNATKEAHSAIKVITSGLPRNYRTVPILTNASPLVVPSINLANFTQGLIVFAITIPEFPESAFVGLWAIERYGQGRLYVVGDVEPTLSDILFVADKENIVHAHTATESIEHLESHPI